MGIGTDGGRVVTPFEKAWAFTSKWEGGYSNHPSDPGGSTQYGITQATYSAWLESQGLPPGDVRDMSHETAGVIAKVRYWDAMGLDDIAARDPQLAIALFDWGFHSGVQNVINRTAGMNTAGEVLDARMEFLANLTNFNSFGRGWVRRVEDLRQVLKPFKELEQVDVELIQMFNGTELVGAFHPTRVSFGTTKSGRTKIMFRIA